MTKMSPNDLRRVVWAIGIFFFSSRLLAIIFSYYLLLKESEGVWEHVMTKCAQTTHLRPCWAIVFHLFSFCVFLLLTLLFLGTSNGLVPATPSRR